MSLLLLLLGSGAAGPTTVTPTGLGATASLGTPVVTVSSTATPTGLEGTASVGTPTPTTVVNATVTPTGVAGTGAVGTPTPTSSIAELQDDFAGGSLDADRWTTAPSSSGVVQTGGLVALSSDYAIRSAKRWRLTGSSIVVQYVQLSPTRDAYVALRDSGGNGLTSRLYGALGRLYADTATLNAGDALPDAYWNGGSLSSTNLQALSGSATADVWVRWREASGTVYFETAPSTASNPPSSGDWTVRWSGTVSGINLGALTLELYASSEAAATEAYFDAVNTASSYIPPGVVRPTGLAATSALGTAVLSSSVVPGATTGTASVGTAGVSVTVPVTGLAATASRGTVALNASTVPTGLAAAGELGTAGVGVRYAPSGLGGTAGLGTPVLGSVVAPSGLSATASRGTHILSASAVLGGLGATGSVGTIATVPGALQVSGRSATSALGTVKVTSVVLGAAAPTTERWLSPRLPTDERMVGILQSSLDRLERTQGRAPVVMTDRRVTSAATLVDADGVVLVDCTAGGVTITLPPATAAIRGRSWAIKKVDSTSNNVTLDGAGSDTIDGSGTYAWNTQNTVVWIQCALVTPPGTYGWVIV